MLPSCFWRVGLFLFFGRRFFAHGFPLLFLDFLAHHRRFAGSELLGCLVIQFRLPSGAGRHLGGSLGISRLFGLDGYLGHFQIDAKR